MAATNGPDGPDAHDQHDETSQRVPRRRLENEQARDEQRDAQDVHGGKPRRDDAASDEHDRPHDRPREGGALIALNRRQPPAPATPAMPNAPDALEPDRILELPPRRPARPRESEAAEEEPTPAPRLTHLRPAALPLHQRLRAVPAAPPDTRSDAQSSATADAALNVRHMISLREAAQPYVARLASRRGTTPPDPLDATRASSPDEPLDPSVCPLCHGVGFVRLDVPVGDKLFGHAVRCECKEREIEERERQKLRDLSSLKPFEKKTFETFETALPSVAEAFDVARRYADDPNGWLILQGGYGCGKTHLAAAIARTREEAGETVFFSIVPDLLDHLRATFAPASEITYDDLFDRVRHVGLLVLDDLGSENSTAWATEKLFQIINYRYNYRLPTVITTNIRLLSHLDDRIRSRLGDLGLVRWVVIDAPDYRERHVGPGSPARPPRTGGVPRGRSNGR